MSLRANEQLDQEPPIWSPFRSSGFTSARMQNRSFCVLERDQVAGCGSCEYEFGSGGLPLRGRGLIVLPVPEEGFLDAPRGGAADALVDRERIA